MNLVIVVQEKNLKNVVGLYRDEKNNTNNKDITPLAIKIFFLDLMVSKNSTLLDLAALKFSEL